MNESDAPKIPPELIRPILEHLADKSCLFSLTMTCKAFQFYAEPLLYSSITKYKDLRPHTLFLTSISTAQRLGPLVQEYTVDSVVAKSDTALWCLLHSALKKMINLKIFTFRELSGQPSAELILHAPFQLKSLYWGNHSDEEAMRVILAEQKSIVSLQLNCDQRTRPYNPDACPNLTSLWGNRHSIQALLPGRKVVNLSWVPELDDSLNDPVVGLDNEFSQIKVMSFGGYFGRPSLSKIAYMLTSLEILELIGCDEEEKVLITTLGSLRELVLSRIWIGPELPFRDDQCEDMVKTYFSALPGLRRIDIACGAAGYRSWVRGSSDIKIRTMFEVLSRFAM